MTGSNTWKKFFKGQSVFIFLENIQDFFRSQSVEQPGGREYQPSLAKSFQKYKTKKQARKNVLWTWP